MEIPLSSPEGTQYPSGYCCALGRGRPLCLPELDTLSNLYKTKENTENMKNSSFLMYSVFCYVFESPHCE